MSRIFMETICAIDNNIYQIICQADNTKFMNDLEQNLIELKTQLNGIVSFQELKSIKILISLLLVINILMFFVILWRTRQTTINQIMRFIKGLRKPKRN